VIYGAEDEMKVSGVCKGGVRKIVENHPTSRKLNFYAELLKNARCFHYSGVASPNFLGSKNCGGTNFLILGEEQYFAWDTASQSTKD